jgi:3-dehydroquinate synthase
MAERIHVKAPGGNYDIIIEPGLLKQTQRLINEFGLGGRVVIVSNITVASLYGQALAESLPAATLICMGDGEQYKTLATVAQLYADFVAAGVDRSTTIVALGGGVVGDAAGFAAATYMRGVRFVQIPTSLLAMVDSSVGGKVGVDLPQGKNLVGAFKQPNVVLIDPDVLHTLPPEQWRCGMAEAVKHGFLADENLLDPALHSPERSPELVRRAVQVKVDVVEQDPFEQNIRAHLNLGHTFGHAIEQVTGYEWLHGEAVGVGMLAAVKLSHALNLCDAALVEQVDDILAETGLPRSLNGLDPEAIYAAMSTDKKWKNGRSYFVLLRAIGQPLIMQDVPKEQIIEVLQSIR